MILRSARGDTVAMLIRPKIFDLLKEKLEDHSMTRNLTLSAVFVAYKICVLNIHFPVFSRCRVHGRKG